jgi:hypothetical protein
MAGERTKALGGWGCLPEARTQVNCNKGDGVCTGAFSISMAHLSYTADGSINKGVNFAAQIISGGKLDGNPGGTCKYAFSIADIPRPDGAAAGGAPSAGGAKGSPKGAPKGKGTGSVPKGSGPPAGGSGEPAAASSPAPAESSPAESSPVTPAPAEESTPEPSAETPAPMAGMAGHEGMEGM